MHSGLIFPHHDADVINSGVTEEAKRGEVMNSLRNP